jgi:hypothetical protein
MIDNPSRPYCTELCAEYSYPDPDRPHMTVMHHVIDGGDCGFYEQAIVDNLVLIDNEQDRLWRYLEARAHRGAR